MHATRRRAVLVMSALVLTAPWITAQQGVRPALADYYTEVQWTMVDPGYAPHGIMFIVSEDLNGDGDQDLVVLGAINMNRGLYNVPQPGGVYLGDGTGSFAPAPAELFPVDTLKTVTPRKVLFSDFNADGRPDMFISSHGWDARPWPGEQNRLYLSLSAGGWRDATATLPQISDFSHSSAAGDITGRGVIDIFVGNGYLRQNDGEPYFLLNDGSGRFSLTRTNIPVGSGRFLAGAFPGSTLTDLNGDGLADLLVTADSSVGATGVQRTTILWNRAGHFEEADRTELPHPAVFTNSHIDHDVQRIDVNQDGLPDLVLTGARAVGQGGWFVQILVNRGNRQFVDETATRVPLGQASGGVDSPGSTLFPLWVRVLDFNHDGAPDFYVQFAPGSRWLGQEQPLIWLNDGTGQFSTLKVSDFVAPGKEWLIGSDFLVETRKGFGFVTTQVFPGRGLELAGLVPIRPYRTTLRILPGGSLRSGSGQFQLTYQSDGNLVLNAADGAALWSSDTGGTQPGQAVMQTDGNYVVYDAAGVARWTSGTAGNPGAYLVVQDDGHLVIFSADGLVLWDPAR